MFTAAVGEQVRPGTLLAGGEAGVLAHVGEPEFVIAVTEEQTAWAKQYGITDPPVVEVVRVVEPAEQPALIEDCMAEAGFESDGGGWEVPMDQKDALGLAMYVRYAQYPIDDKHLTPLTDLQRERGHATSDR